MRHFKLLLLLLAVMAHTGTVSASATNDIRTSTAQPCANALRLFTTPNQFTILNNDFEAFYEGIRYNVRGAWTAMSGNWQLTILVYTGDMTGYYPVGPFDVGPGGPMTNCPACDELRIRNILDPNHDGNVPWNNGAPNPARPGERVLTVNNSAILD